jgi:drug/metabolite transporter (DMT)-like permease
MALLVAAIIWGSSFLIVKNTVGSLSVHYLLVVRFFIGVMALSLVVGRRLSGMNRATLARGVLLGLLLYASYSSQTMGVSAAVFGSEATTAGKSAFLSCLYCVLTPFLLWAIERKKPDRFSVVAAFLCALGIGMLVLSDDRAGVSKGDMATLASAVFIALYIVYTSKFLKSCSAILLIVVQFGTVAVVSAVIALLFEPFPSGVGLEVWGSAVYLGIFCTAIALGLQIFGQKYAHPNSSALLLSLEGPFGVLFAVLFGGSDEQLTLRLAVGFAIILVAIIVSETKLKFKASP